MMRRWKILTTVILCLVLVGVVACRPGGGGGDESEFTGQLVEVVRGDLMLSVSGDGSVDVASEMRLSFENGGEVAKVYVERGDVVEEGRILAVLTPLETDTLQLAVIQAGIALAQAEYNLDEAENPYTDEDIQDAEEAVENAEDFLDIADEMLRYVSIHGSDWEVNQWQMEVLNAEIQLEMAEETLDDMLNERDEEWIEILRMQVYAAEQIFAGAQDDLEIETITAPFDGAVADIYVEEGDVIPPSSVSQVTVVQLIDITRMELVVNLDEIDIPGVRMGQKVVIIVDALPDLQLEGRVVSIYPLPTVDAGLVQYSAKISFEVPEDSGLRVGMSTTADIILTERQGVLLVPDRAIDYSNAGNTIVRVVLSGPEGTQQIEERPVVIGLSDGFQTEIISGLTEGEIVILGVPEDSGISPGGGFLFGSP